MSIEKSAAIIQFIGAHKVKTMSSSEIVKGLNEIQDEIVDRAKTIQERQDENSALILKAALTGEVQFK